MTGPRDLASRGRDEAGLVGKLLVLALVVVALLGVAALDVGSVILARVRTSEVASDAAFAAAQAYAATGERADAELVARRAVEDSDGDARLRRITFGGHAVTVVVVDRAGTLLLGRIGGLEQFARVTVTETSSASRN
jgi:hypothetical protein